MGEKNSSSVRPSEQACSVSVVLLLHDEHLAAWRVLPGSLPTRLRIKGEDRVLVSGADALAAAHDDLTQSLCYNGADIGQLLWIVDDAGRILGAADKPAWQLPWKWLAKRFGLSDASPWDVYETLHDQILPWLITDADAAQRQRLQQARESEHASETERLALERAALLQENERLRAQSAALQQVDAERLVSFLPALYPRVFTVIGSTDLGLLCGRVGSIDLPNPYPEPAEETLRTLQKRFRVLPLAVQKQIVGFVTSLPQSQKLQSRPEMRELVEELIGL